MKFLLQLIMVFLISNSMFAQEDTVKELKTPYVLNITDEMIIKLSDDSNPRYSSPKRYLHVNYSTNISFNIDSLFDTTYATDEQILNRLNKVIEIEKKGLLNALHTVNYLTLNSYLLQGDNANKLIINLINTTIDDYFKDYITADWSNKILKEDQDILKASVVTIGTGIFGASGIDKFTINMKTDIVSSKITEEE